MSETLALWDQVSRTDPAFTKPFSRGGGFRGTATNATYLARKATEMFGPCGLGWGVKVLDESILDGADGDKVHRVHVELWYRWQGEVGRIEHFGQTMLSGRYKSGPFTDEEAPKKSLTDAMTKALSLLGFAADVHLGLYDDNKYVAELKAEFAGRQNGAEVKSSRQAKKDGDWALIEVGIDDCGNTRELLEWVPKALPTLRGLKPDWQEQALEAWGKALAEKLAGECHDPLQFNQWAVEHDKAIERLPELWLKEARLVWREQYKALRTAQPVEVMAS